MSIPEAKLFEAFPPKDSSSMVYLSPKMEVLSETAKETDGTSISGKSHSHQREDELSLE